MRVAWPCHSLHCQVAVAIIQFYPHNSIWWPKQSISYFKRRNVCSLIFFFSAASVWFSAPLSGTHLHCVWRQYSYTLCLPPMLLNSKANFVLFNIFDCCLIPHAGYYTCVEVIFTLRRQVGFYMMGVYAPTLLIVVLSWLSFWINPDASAARVPLGMVYLVCSTTWPTTVLCCYSRVDYMVDQRRRRTGWKCLCY